MARKRDLFWRLRLIGRKEIIAVLAVIAVVAVFTALSTIPRRPVNSFGPDWDCTPVPQGDPVCVKRVPPPAKN
jgi:hypothetical protein